MKRIVRYLTTLVLFLLLFASCYYDNEEALYPTLRTSCDTTNVTFSGTIVTILRNNCYTCHSNANAAFGGNIRLEAIEDVKTNSAKLIVAIKQTGTKPMPPSGKLKACSIIQFDIWIGKGMVNN